jgi:hypothetical protein
MQLPTSDTTNVLENINPLLDDDSLWRSPVLEADLEWWAQSMVDEEQDEVDRASKSSAGEQVEPVAVASPERFKGRRDRENLFLQDVCVRDGVLVDPQSGRVCDELKLYVRLSLATKQLPKKSYCRPR